ncbi:MAG: ThuA domain-containing protein [Isosphaeraceae bacterium]
MLLNRRQSFAAAAPPRCSRACCPVRKAAPGAEYPKKVLYFTKSSGFEHSIVKRNGDSPAFSEKILAEIAAPHGYDVTCSKDGRLFDPDKIGQWDAFVFCTTGDLTTEGTDKQPAMSAAGKQAFLDAIAAGKGFMGMHCATDTFHSKGGEVDPYIKMIGGEFAGHGDQMPATLEVADKDFPRLAAYNLASFRLTDEWYSQKNLANDLHVVLVQLTDSMPKRENNNKMYGRPSFPQTWTRQHGKGRVFYTSMGHREDVWLSPLYRDLLIGGLDFITGKSNIDASPNVEKVTPGYLTLT